MKKYDVIIDLGSYTIQVKAENKLRAEQKALIEFEKNMIPEDYWVAECDEVKE